MRDFLFALSFFVAIITSANAATTTVGPFPNEDHSDTLCQFQIITKTVVDYAEAGRPDDVYHSPPDNAAWEQMFYSVGQNAQGEDVRNYTVNWNPDPPVVTTTSGATETVTQIIIVRLATTTGGGYPNPPTTTYSDVDPNLISTQ